MEKILPTLLNEIKLQMTEMLMLKLWKHRENSKTLWGVQAIAQYKAKHCLDYRPPKQAKMLMLKAIEKSNCDNLT